jgi:hypothetical protein
MNPAVAALRHDLRTVVNHLLGYTEMLLEDADATGPVERIGALERIRAAAHQILAGIDESLPATSVSLTSAGVARMGAAVRDPASRILIECAMIGGVWANDPTEAADIARIATSARALLRFADDGPSALGIRASATALAESESVAAAAPEASPASRILVADDDATNRDLFGRRLARLGHQVAFAADGREALALLARRVRPRSARPDDANHGRRRSASPASRGFPPSRPSRPDDFRPGRARECCPVDRGRGGRLPHQAV